jgi:hypothetical protein
MILHKNKNYADAFDRDIFKKERILSITEYWKTKFEKKEFEDIDQKLWDVLDENFLNIFQYDV